jgi:hypothetical protein
MNRTDKVTSDNYIPGLHPDMPEWKKVLRYTKLMDSRFPVLGSNTTDTSSHKARAVAYVDDELKEYAKKARREEEKKRQQKEKQQAAHVAAMERKYGLFWYECVEDEEDCNTAYKLRQEHDSYAEPYCMNWKEEEERGASSNEEKRERLYASWDEQDMVLDKMGFDVNYRDSTQMS